MPLHSFQTPTVPAKFRVCQNQDFLGLYRGNGKENGNYHMIGYILGLFKQCARGSSHGMASSGTLECLGIHSQ